MPDSKKPTSDQSKDREAELLKLLGLTKAEADARIEGVIDEAARKEFGPPYDDVWRDDPKPSPKELADAGFVPRPMSRAERKALRDAGLLPPGRMTKKQRKEFEDAGLLPPSDDIWE